MPKIEADPWSALPPSERAFKKIATLGDNALLDYDEIAAVIWSVGGTAVRAILEGVPCAKALPQVKRWRYGTLVEHARKLEELSAA